MKLSFKGTIEDIKEGLVYLKGTTGLLLLLIFVMLSNFIITSMFNVVFPFYIREVVGFSGEQFGFLQTSWVAGILLGNIILGTFLSKKKAAKLFKRGIITQSFINIIFSITTFPIILSFFGGNSWTYFSVIAGLFISIGICNAFVNTPMYAWFQKTVPSQYRSRVFSVVAILIQLITPIGAFLFGVGLDYFKTHYLILGGNLLNFTFILIFLALGMTRILKEFDKTEQKNNNS